MKKIHLILILFSCLIFNQSFSQKSKTDIKPDLIETIKIMENKSPKAYCSSIYTNQSDDWITNVSINTINNYSGQNGSNSYGDYTYLSTDLSYGMAYTFDVSFYSGSFTQHVWLFIDWNHNDIFDSEESYDLGEGVSATLTFFVGPPDDALPGSTRMRVIEQYNSDPGPCDPHGSIYGETEDYTINVYGNENYWTGAVDNNWHNAANWLYNFVPDATTDVTIWDVTNKCWVWAGSAFCNNLTVNFGSGYDLRIWDQDLYVSGDMDFYGQLLMDHTDGRIIARENVTWYTGSTASIQANAVFEVHGDWNFQSGANVAMDDGTVYFTGTGISSIVCHEESCYFNNLVSFKSGFDWVDISSASTENLHIHGDIGIEPDCDMEINSAESVILLGDFINLGSLETFDGTMIFDGSTQNIFWNGTIHDNFYFNNLTISSSNSTTILNSINQGIIIYENLVLEEGLFIPNNYTISIHGDWNNQIGPSAFVEGNGRVIFTGTSSYIFGDENFNILELNKSTFFDLLQIDGNTVTCQQYDWTEGSISVRLGGSFTANDLIDNGIYGGWGVDNTGGTINISNYGDWVDLNGYISLTGGTMNVYGGTTPSYWPLSANAEIYMTDGVLDFHDQGIYITDYTGYTLTENITGGTIRTAGGFWGESSDFSPDYGMMEFYGGNDANIYTINGCYLNDVFINKATKENSKVNSQLKSKFSALVDERSGKPIGDGTKSNSLTQTGFLDINGSLVIENGILNTNGYNIQIEGDWTNFVGDAGFIESTGWVTFDNDDNVGSIIHTYETFNNLMLYSNASGIPGLTILDGVEVNITNSLDLQLSSLNMGFASMVNVGGDIFIADEAGLNADDGDNLITIGGNWTNENDPNTIFEGFWPGGETVVFDGLTDQTISVTAPEETYTNLIINKTSGEFKPNDNIQVLGNLHIQYGDWRDNIPLLSHSFYGDFIIDMDGNYYPEYETCFKGESDQVYETFGGDGIFKKLVIDKTPAKNSFGYKGGGSKDLTLTLNSDMVVHDGYGTSIEEGNFFLNGHLFNPMSHMYMEDGSALIVNEGAVLVLSSALYMNGGEFISYGSPGNEATVTNGALGEYQFQVGGTISSNHTLFEGMNSNGIWITTSAIVDVDNAFNNCVFGSGDNLSGSIRLTINNNQILNLDNVSFIDNPYVTGSINVGKFYNQGELNFTNFNGNFSGPEFENDQYDKIHWIPNEYRIQAKVFLEGPFNGTHMTPWLNSILPLNHPFNPSLPYFGNPFPDWYYNIPGAVPFIPDPNIVDWVLVQLRDAISPATALPATNIATTPAFVMEDGSIIALDGSSQLSFNVTPLNNLYVVIWHRNHLGVISANPLTEIGGIYPYDFTTSASQAYGGSSAQVQLSLVPEIWGMMAGDADGNGNIQLQDLNNIWDMQVGNTGYLESDFNLDAQSDNKDKNDFWLYNEGKGSSVPE